MRKGLFTWLVLMLVSTLQLMAQTTRTEQTISFVGLNGTGVTLHSAPNSENAIGTATVYGNYKNEGDNGISFGDGLSFEGINYKNDRERLAQKRATWFNVNAKNEDFRLIPMGGSHIKVTVKEACKVYADVQVLGGCSMIFVEDDRLLYNRNATPDIFGGANGEYALFYARPGHTYYISFFFGANKSDTYCRISKLSFVTQNNTDPSLNDFLTGNLPFEHLIKAQSGEDQIRYDNFLHHNQLQWPLMHSIRQEMNPIPRMGFTLPDVSVAVGGYINRTYYRRGHRLSNPTEDFGGTYQYELNAGSYVNISSALRSTLLQTENKDNKYFMTKGQGYTYFKRPIQGASYIVEAFTPKKVTLKGYAEQGMALVITDEMGRPIAADSVEAPVVINATYDSEKKAYITRTDGTSKTINGKAAYLVSATFNALPGKTYFVFGDDLTTTNLSERNKGMFYLSGIKQEAINTQDIVSSTENLILDGTQYTPVSTTTYYPKAVIKKKLVANKWSTIVLPFSMTERQVNTTFGDNTMVLALDSISYVQTVNKNGVETKQFKLNQSRHYYTFIPAGCPVLIKPTLNTYDTSGSVSVEQVTVDNGVTLVKGQDVVHEWGGKDFVCTGSFTNLSTNDLQISERAPIYFLSGNDGTIKQRTRPIALPAFSMIYVPQSLAALKKGSADVGAKGYAIELVMDNPNGSDDNVVSGISSTLVERKVADRVGVYNLMG